MSRIVHDKNGYYDLSQVCRVAPIPQVQQQGAGHSPVPLPPTARLHFDSGDVAHTQLSYDEVLARWLEVKRAEGHPSDAPISTENRPS